MPAALQWPAPSAESNRKTGRDIAGQVGTSVYQVATVYAVFKRLPASRSEEVEAAR